MLTTSRYKEVACGLCVKGYGPLTEKYKRILVTGANGFIGSHLTEALLSRGYEVRCMVRRTSDLTYLRDLPVEWFYADLRNTDDLRQACIGIDAVCHCAALTRALDEETFFRVNTQGSEALARACLEANPGLRRFLFVSSAAAIGPSHGPDDIVDESSPPRPITWYGKSKWAAEQALRSMNGRLPLTIVRPTAVFGPRDRDFFTYFELVHRRLALKLGRQERRISLIYVHDLVELILLALENESALGQTYFGRAYVSNYSQFSEMIARALDKRPITITLPEMVLTPIEWWSKVEAKITGRPALLNDQRILDMREHYWLCSSDKARQELGFAPHHDLEAAVQATADWYQENGWL